MPEDLRLLRCDDNLVFGIVGELKQKLNNHISMFMPGVIVVRLKRSCDVVVRVSLNHVSIQMNELPDGSSVEKESHSLFDPEFDPIKQICRFVDKSHKLIKSYEREAKESRIFLGDVL